MDFESTAVGAYTSATAVSGWTVSSQTNTNCNTNTNWLQGSPEFSIVSTPIFGVPYMNTLASSPLGGTKIAQLNDFNGNARSTKLIRTFSVSPNSYLSLAYAGVIQEWDPLESTCRHASLSIL